MRDIDRKYLRTLDETLSCRRDVISDEQFEKILKLRSKFIEIADVLIYKKPNWRARDNALKPEQVYVRHWELRNKIESLKREITGLMPTELDYNRHSIQSRVMPFPDSAEEFYTDIQYLKKSVEEEIRYCYDDIKKEGGAHCSSPRVKSLEAKIKNLKNLLSLELNNEYELEYAVWLFNNGNLRNPVEINDKKKELENKEYTSYRSDIECSEEYDKHYHPIGLFVNTLLFSPMLIGIFTGLGGDGTWGYYRGLFLGNIIRAYFDCCAMLYIPIWILAIFVLWIYVSIHHDDFYITGNEELKQACLAAAVGITTAAAGKAINKHFSDKKPDI